jgi:hypothetical protein
VLLAVIARSQTCRVEEGGDGPDAWGDAARLTAADLAGLCSCHRVTAQRAVQALRGVGVLRRVSGRRLQVVWEALADLAERPPAPGDC